MMQIIGNPVECWELTSHASRAIVALGFHQIDKTVPENDVEKEIYAIVGNCAYLDSVMSLLLLRPRSLPKLRVRVSDFLRDQNNAMSMLEMIPVHDKILDLMLDSNAKRSPAVLKNEVAELRSQMEDIYKLMEKVSKTISS